MANDPSFVAGLQAADGGSERVVEEAQASRRHCATCQCACTVAVEGFPKASMADVSTGAIQPSTSLPSSSIPASPAPPLPGSVVREPPQAPLGETTGEHEDVSDDEEDDSFFGQLSRRLRKPTKDELMAVAEQMGDHKLAHYLNTSDEWNDQVDKLH